MLPTTPDELEHSDTLSEAMYDISLIAIGGAFASIIFVGTKTFYRWRHRRSDRKVNKQTYIHEADAVYTGAGARILDLSIAAQDHRGVAVRQGQGDPPPRYDFAASTAPTFPFSTAPVAQAIQQCELDPLPNNGNIPYAIEVVEELSHLAL